LPDVAVLIFDDCQPSAVTAVIEALSIANLQSAMANEEDEPPFTWRTISFDGRPVRAMGGIRLVADGSQDSLGRPDLIFIPAFRSEDQRVQNKSIQRLNAQWGDILRSHYRGHGYVAANCTGTFVLAEAGLLDGRTATTSWWLSRCFRNRYPRVRLLPEMLVTKDARIFCAAAFSACLNLGLEIVAEFLGPRAAVSCARIMLVDVNRTAQLPYANLQDQIQHGDDLVLRAQTLLLSNLTRSVHLEELAERLRVTSRTLSRRFKAAIGETPLTFLQHARIERSKRLLETTRASFDEIAHRVGYEDASSFRRLFVRATGISPRDYRGRFGTHKSKRRLGRSR
jgi:transcriptional regulator GlxA family with amidase domain